jgi:hypothetical protein
VVDENLLHELLLAASLHMGSRDPAQDINNYLVTNAVLPPNIRSDSGQTEVWRDYQQVLSESGLIFSTRISAPIRFTAAGLAYLDKTSSFKDILTIQAFRWQYPNGHNTQRGSGDQSGTSFAEQQMAAGVLIRPSVLVWQVLQSLEHEGGSATLSAAEIENFLMPARTHEDTDLVVAALLSHRRSSGKLPRDKNRRRRASDWIIRLSRTHTFQLNADKTISLSQYSIQNQDELAETMRHLTQPDQWWFQPQAGPAGESWYQWYGTLDANQYPIPPEDSEKDRGFEQYEPDDEEQSPRAMQLLTYLPNERERQGTDATITSTYAADISESAHRLHDTMLRLVADRCMSKGAAIFFDPKAVDLLVQYSGIELLLEVKSATSANYVRKLRGGLGQVLQYDYLRSKASHTPRRKAVALTIDIPENHWSKDFVANYLDMDLVALRAGALHTYSTNPIVMRLLSPAA